MSHIGHVNNVLLLSPKSFLYLFTNVYQMKSFIMKKVVCIGNNLKLNQNQAMVAEVKRNLKSFKPELLVTKGSHLKQKEVQLEKICNFVQNI